MEIDMEIDKVSTLTLLDGQARLAEALARSSRLLEEVNNSPTVEDKQTAGLINAMTPVLVALKETENELRRRGVEVEKNGT